MSARQWVDDGGLHHVDVRGLPPPEPFVTIMRWVASALSSQVLIVHHERDPLLLHAELADVGWQAELIPGDQGEVRLRIERRA